LDRAKIELLNGAETAFKDKDKTESGRLVQGYINNYLEHAPIIGITNRYDYIKYVLPTITLQEVNALAAKTESKQGKFALLMAPEKNAAQLPTDKDLLAMVDAARQIPVKAYEEKAIAKTLMDKLPTPGKITSETTNATLGTTDITLSNGVTITMRPTDFKNDDIQMDSWRWGGSYNFGLANKLNAANAPNIVMNMGVKDMSSIDLGKFLAGKTVEVQPYINPYDEGMQANSSVKDFETLLQLVYLYFTAPRRDATLFNAFVSTQKGFLKNMLDNPRSYFGDTLTKVEYANNPWMGTPHAEDYDKVSLDSVMAIYKQVFGNVYGWHFTFVGNIDMAKANPLLETYLGSLPSTQKENKFTDVGIRPVKGIVDLPVKKGAEKQSLVNVIFNGEAPYTKVDELKLTALTNLLTIKIIEKLREDMSGIYGGGMRGTLINRPYGHYSVSLSFPCGPENVDKLVQAAFGIIKNAKDSGVAQADLDKVKETLKKQNEDGMKDNEHWLDGLSFAWIEKTDPQWILDYAKNVDALTVQDIQDAAKKYLDMQNYIKAVLYPEK